MKRPRLPLLRPADRTPRALVDRPLRDSRPSWLLAQPDPFGLAMDDLAERLRAQSEGWR